MSGAPRRPMAVRLDDPTVMVADRTVGVPPPETVGTVVIESTPEPTEPAAVPAVVGARGWSWGSVLMTALGALGSLAIGLMVDQLIRDLFARADALGYIGLGITALALVALIVVIGRELIGLRRLARTDRLRLAAQKASEQRDPKAALQVVEDFTAFIASVPDAARGRQALAEHRAAILDGRDLLALAERDVLGPLDQRAIALVMDSARQVSLVTAISPRALIDIGVVVLVTVRLIRRLADLYGGRPGTLGFLRLLRAVLGHLAITGGMAIGDTLVQQLVGQGLAARLSAKLGEGVVNGLLTARVGLAAIDLTRPLPFLHQPRPSLGDMMSELTRWPSTPPDR